MKRERAEVPEDLTVDERTRLWEWVGTRYPHLKTRAAMRRLTDECLAHWGAKGNPHGYRDWYRAVQKWIVKDQHFADQRKEARPEPRVELWDGEPKLRVVK
jgi:hypothetical protein